MTNPILNALGRNNGMFNRIAEIKQIINGQPADVLYNRLMQTNPGFSQFVQQNKGKSAEQIAIEHGVDPSIIQQILK